MSASSKNASADSGDLMIDVTPIPLLQDIQDHGRVWSDLAAQYGVTNPDPPWKITLEATCDLLAGDSAVKAYGDIVPGSCALPSLERRAEEDELSETLYEDVPFPERQLLALAHSMIKRGLVDEGELARRMEEVGQRLKSV
ncbi:MAG: hypothetical protein KKA22_15170 [Gammaproteobacteria bacterium]|jgi:hypothetical protein|nr:hypothetical protein [Gammaproteobacteria bacterium]MBU1409478.1 hypothetical protein [Gammaproteobacteria bacterium]MBU1530660.1 hypothetical protein [Gammaproteobacteria bacterium]